MWHHVTNKVDFNVEKYWEIDVTVTTMSGRRCRGSKVTGGGGGDEFGLEDCGDGCVIREDVDSFLRCESEDPSSKIVGDGDKQIGDGVGVGGGLGVGVETGDGRSWSESRATVQFVGVASDELDNLEARGTRGS